MLAYPLPPSFLGTYILSMSTRCKALCIVINFLIFWAISSLVHLKNGPNYLTLGTSKVFSLWRDSCFEKFFSFVWDTFFFLVFSFIPTFLMVFASNDPKFSSFSFSPSVLNFFFFFFLTDLILLFTQRVFNISFSWQFFTGVWVTASLLKSPGLFSEF